MLFLSIDAGSMAQESSLQMCHQRKWLPMVAHREEEEPGALAGDPRGGGLGLYSAIPLDRASRHNMFVFCYLNWLYKCFKENINVFLDNLVMRVRRGDAESHFSAHYNEQSKGRHLSA